MPEYVLDTSLDMDKWHGLDAFTQGYIEAAFWTGNEEEGIPGKGLHDLADITLTSIKADCADFQSSNQLDLEHAYSELDYSPDRAGHDFWLTRNRHGAGFWNRGLGDIGKQLTDAAHAYGEIDLYVGDDGMVYVQ